jgi:hypothetical protein
MVFKAAPRSNPGAIKFRRFPRQAPALAGLHRNRLLRSQFYPAGSMQVKD